MKVFLSELAASKLLKINNYLLESWNKNVRDSFVDKLNSKINQISLHPESCPKSVHFFNLYKCVVTKQITFYYQINNKLEEIEIITIFDTRQNPEKLNKEL